MLADRKVEPVSCRKNTPRRRPPGLEFPISSAPPLDLAGRATVHSLVHKILCCPSDECKAMPLHPMVVLSDRP